MFITILSDMEFGISAMKMQKSQEKLLWKLLLPLRLLLRQVVCEELLLQGCLEDQPLEQGLQDGLGSQIRSGRQLLFDKDRTRLSIGQEELQNSDSKQVVFCQKELLLMLLPLQFIVLHKEPLLIRLISILRQQRILKLQPSSVLSLQVIKLLRRYGKSELAQELESIFKKVSKLPKLQSLQHDEDKQQVNFEQCSLQNKL